MLCAWGSFAYGPTTLNVMTSFLLSLFLLGAVVVRVTRLFAVDELMRPWRDFWLGRLGAASKINYLMWCPWCLGVWFAAPAAGVLVWLNPAPDVHLAIQFLGAGAAMALAAGWITDATYGGDE